MLFQSEPRVNNPRRAAIAAALAAHAGEATTPTPSSSSSYYTTSSPATTTTTTTCSCCGCNCCTPGGRRGGHSDSSSSISSSSSSSSCSCSSCILNGAGIGGDHCTCHQRSPSSSSPTTTTTSGVTPSSSNKMTSTSSSSSSPHQGRRQLSAIRTARGWVCEECHHAQTKMRNTYASASPSAATAARNDDGLSVVVGASNHHFLPASPSATKVLEATPLLKLVPPEDRRSRKSTPPPAVASTPSNAAAVLREEAPAKDKQGGEQHNNTGNTPLPPPELVVATSKPPAAPPVVAVAPMQFIQTADVKPATQPSAAEASDQQQPTQQEAGEVANNAEEGTSLFHEYLDSIQQQQVQPQIKKVFLKDSDCQTDPMSARSRLQQASGQQGAAQTGVESDEHTDEENGKEEDGKGKTKHHHHDGHQQQQPQQQQQQKILYVVRPAKKNAPLPQLACSWTQTKSTVETNSIGTQHNDGGSDPSSQQQQQQQQHKTLDQLRKEFITASQSPSPTRHRLPGEEEQQDLASSPTSPHHHHGQRLPTSSSSSFSVQVDTIGPQLVAARAVRIERCVAEESEKRQQLIELAADVLFTSFDTCADLARSIRFARDSSQAKIRQLVDANEAATTQAFLMHEAALRQQLEGRGMSLLMGHAAAFHQQKTEIALVDLKKQVEQHDSVVARLNEKAEGQRVAAAALEHTLRDKLRKALLFSESANMRTTAAPVGATSLGISVVDMNLPIEVRFSRAHAIAKKALELERGVGVDVSQS